MRLISPQDSHCSIRRNKEGNFKKNEDFSVIKFFVNFKDDIHIHSI